jgi:hypothetical protein
MLKDGATSEGAGKAQTLRDHPVALSLIGIGVGWFAMAAIARRLRSGDGGDALRERAAEGAGHVAGGLGARLATASSSSALHPTEPAGYAYARHKSTRPAGEAGEVLAPLEDAGAAAEHGVSRAADAGAAAWRQAKGYARAAGEQFRHAGDRLAKLVAEHPLALGALAFLAGSAVALMLPPTAVEERLAGSPGAAATRGREAAQSAQSSAEEAADAVQGALKEAPTEGSHGARKDGA